MLDDVGVVVVEMSRNSWTYVDVLCQLTRLCDGCGRGRRLREEAPEKASQYAGAGIGLHL